MYHEIMEEQAKVEVALKQLNIRGKAYAIAERDYNIAIAVEILRLRTEGQPVTIVEKLARGLPKVANLRMERTIAETMYKSAMEAINVLKLKIKIMEAQYDREYGNTR